MISFINVIFVVKFLIREYVLLNIFYVENMKDNIENLFVLKRWRLVRGM